MKKSLLFSLFLILVVGNLFSQQFPVSFPSPEAAGLGIVGNLPVNHHTGKVNINIPLMEVEDKGYRMPISLSYNSSGLMPDVRPTWVGQNWSLQVGGVITRSIKGLPDEKNIYGFRESYSRLQVPDWSSSETLYSVQSSPYYLGGPSDFALSNYADYYDTEPDEYSFNVNGLSGKFCIGGDGKFKVLSDPGIKIECNMNDLISVSASNGVTGEQTFKGFKIISKEGIIYHFGFNANLIETSFCNLTGASPANSYATSWYLAKIEIPQNNEAIHFNYSPKYTDINVSSSEMVTSSAWKWDGKKWLYQTGSCSDSGTYTNLYTINHIYLKSIVGSNFTLQFSTSKANDLTHSSEYNPNWQKLDSITLKDASGNRVKGFSFSYDVGTINRLFLKSVGEKGLPPHEFEYNGGKEIGYDIKQVDHWGYYNGFQNPSSRIPGTFSLSGSNLTYFEPHREADLVGVTTGLLQRITYPTGGEIFFDFDCNEYSRFCQKSSLNLSFVDVKRAWEPQWHYNTWEGNENFTIQNQAYIDLEIFDRATDKSIKRVNSMLDAGTYTSKYFLQRSELPENPDDYVFVITYKELIPTTNALGGGARIRRITYNDGSSSFTKEYLYVKSYTPNATSFVSSGILGVAPLYNYKINLEGKPYGSYTGYYDAYCSQPISVVSLTEGSPVGYSEVVEITKDRLNNSEGYTIYKYSNFDTNPDLPPTNATSRLMYDVGRKNSKEVERGKLLLQTDFSKNGNKVREKTYSYRNTLRESIRAIENRKFFLTQCQMLGIIGHIATAYEINNNSYLPDNVKETVYNADGTNPVTSNMTYQYNPYDFVRESVIQGSDNNLMKKEFKYPSDLKTISPYDEMFSKNILSPVIEQTEYKNANIFLKKEVNSYSKWHSSFYAPSNNQVQTANQQSPEIRVVYNYDSKGNPREIVKDNTNKVVYLWGYNYQYPIAQIEGATYEDVKAILGESQINSLALSSSPDVNNIGSQLRSGFSSKPVLVTTYTYKPLEGMLSKTDPRGVTTTYDYDDFGRLKTVKDHNGAIVESYQYNYQNQ